MNGGLTREQAVRGNAQRVLIGSGTRCDVPELLGAHVRRRANLRARFCHRVAAHRFGNAEVGENYVALHIDEDVRGLDVAVRDPFRVSERQSARRLQQDPTRLLHRKRLARIAEFVQRTAFDQPHDEENEFFAVLDVVHHNDVGVLQPCRDSRFLQEAFGHALGEGQARVHDF